MVLFNQFKYFQNFFFLMMALTQFVPILKVGIIYTYFVPLAFVLSVTMAKEAFEDIKRHRLDMKVSYGLRRPILPSFGCTATRAATWCSPDFCKPETLLK